MPHPILALETSVQTGSVALLAHDEVLCEKSFVAGRRPSSTLWPALQEVMAGVTQISAIVVGTGPGSYNGSRVGIAAAQGIALVQDCPVAPLCSFEGVQPVSHEAWALGDARRGSFSLQKVVAGRIQGDFLLVSKEELEIKLQKAFADGQEVFSFDPASRFPIEEDLQKQIVARQSEASLLARAFAHRSESEQVEITQKTAEPFYLRAPHITPGKKKSPLARASSNN